MKILGNNDLILLSIAKDIHIKGCNKVYVGKALFHDQMLFFCMSSVGKNVYIRDYISRISVQKV